MKLPSFLFILIFLIEIQTVKSQVEWSCVLYNISDSSPLAYSFIYIEEIDAQIQTDEHGDFKTVIPSSLKNVHLKISSIGCHQDLIHSIQLIGKDSIKLECNSIFLQEFTFLYEDPESVLKKAINLISKNFADSSYISFANYRQYQKINHIFQNLTEAQSAVLFRLETKDKTLYAKEAIALNEMRRSKKFDAIEEIDGDKYKNLLIQNPIYHLQTSSLNIANFNQYQFSFDSTAPEDLYIIQYKRKGFSSENHGIENYSQAALSGESVEKGEITIEKETYAILKYERRTERNPNYHYPKYNNFIRPHLNYTMEFANGYLNIEYKNIDGKYYLNRINYCYTNLFYKAQLYTKEYEITDYFNWELDSITNYLSSDLLQKFTEYTSINVDELPYHSEAWLHFNLPNYFSPNEKIADAFNINQ